MSRDTKTSGIVLDRFLSLMLGFFASQEGINKLEQERWLALGNRIYQKYDSAIVKELEVDILSSTLINGGMHLLLPNVAMNFLDLSVISKEGIPSKAHVPYNQKVLDKLNGLHNKIDSLARFLENDSRYTNVFSYEALIDGKLQRSDYVEFSTNVDEYIYYSELFLKEIQWLRNLSPGLFSTFMENFLVFNNALKESFTEHNLSAKRKHKPKKNPDSYNTLNIFELMGLLPRKDLAFRPYGIELISDVFPNNYFGDFTRYDNVWGEYSINSFLDHSTRQLESMFTDPIRLSHVHSFWRTWFEVKTLINISATQSARINLPSEIKHDTTYQLSSDEEKLQLFKLYIKEVNSIPRIESFRDLFRLYNHKYVDNFRRILDEWVLALHDGNINVLDHMQKDFEYAKKDLATVAKMQKVGNILTVVALPVAIAGLLAGLPLDFGFTAIGPGILAYANAIEKEAEWVKFGNLNS